MRALLVAGFQADRIGLQGPGIADFGCYRLSRSTVPFSLGAKMTKSEQWQGIPTELSLEQFRQFVLPHLSIGSRGPAPKLSLHALFGYILKRGSQVSGVKE
jgi:hypothetical protein